MHMSIHGINTRNDASLIYFTSVSAADATHITSTINNVKMPATNLLVFAFLKSLSAKQTTKSTGAAIQPGQSYTPV